MFYSNQNPIAIVSPVPDRLAAKVEIALCGIAEAVSDLRALGLDVRIDYDRVHCCITVDAVKHCCANRCSTSEGEHFVAKVEKK